MFAERFDEVQKHYGCEKDVEFCKITKIPTSTFSKAKNGINPVGSDILQKMAASFKDLNMDWFLTGEGRMLKRNEFDEAVMVAYPNGHVRREFIQDNAVMVAVPFLTEMPVSAGGGAFDGDEYPTTQIYFSERLLWDFYKLNSKNLAVFPIVGDSMVPLFQSGDLVLVDLFHGDRKFRFDGVYIVRIDGYLMAKQVQILPGNILEVISKNPTYKAFTINLLDESIDFAVIGRVVVSMRGV